MAPKILIATPAYGDMVHRGYHESIAGMVSAFARAAPGIVFEQKVVNIPVLSMARNILVSLVLDDPSFTHLLFVDADMAFSPSLVAKMLQSGRPFVACVYPEKRTQWQKLGETLADPDVPTMQARLIASSYVCAEAVMEKILSDGRHLIEVVDGMVEFGLVGTGVVLISREALLRLREGYRQLWVEEPAAEIRERGLTEGGLLRCFDTFVNEDGYMVGEDIAFCHRWRQIGGEIWAVIDEAIVHQGVARYQGHALIALKSDPAFRVRGVQKRARGRDDAWYLRALRG